MRHRVLWAAAAAVALVAFAGAAVPAPDGPGADAELVRQLAGESTREAAADKLYDQGWLSVEPLLAGLADPAVRDPAIAVLDRLGPDAKDAAPALIAIVQDAASPSRRAAAKALGSMGAEASAAIAPLTSLLADAKAKAQTEAAEALGSIATAAARRGIAPTAAATSVAHAVDAGLDWLVRHRDGAGLWSSGGFDKACSGEPKCAGKSAWVYDVGVTSLALLAFVDNGETPLRGKRHAVVKAGFAALAAGQRADGLIGAPDSLHVLYEHAVATLALAEAYRLTKMPALETPLRRAIAVVEATRNRDAAWRYELAPKGDNDTSLTNWMARALVSASDAAIKVDPAGLRGALSWVESMTEPEYGRTGYQQKGGPPARLQECLNTFPADKSEALTAAGLLVRLAAGRTAENDPMVAKGAALLATKPPRWDLHDGSIDLYYWMHGAEAMRRLGGAPHVAWSKALAAALLKGQVAAEKSCARGSWDAVDPWSPAAGRVYTTSAALIALANWTDAPPEKKPAMNAVVRSATWALEKVAKSGDKTAQRALDAIRAAYTSK